MKRYIGAILNFVFNEVISHIPCHFIRKQFLCILNRKIDRSVTVLMHTKLINPWSLEIGKHCIINQYVMLDCRQYKIVIKDCVDIGAYSRIWTLGHDPDDDGHALKGGDVVIESHVWIASGVTVLPGITLAKGCVIASGSVVTRSMTELMVCAGNPAKAIRKRKNSLVYTPIYTPLFD